MKFGPVSVELCCFGVPRDSNAALNTEYIRGSKLRALTVTGHVVKWQNPAPVIDGVRNALMQRHRMLDAVYIRQLQPSRLA
jgi:hypothetical protein